MAAIFRRALICLIFLLPAGGQADIYSYITQADGNPRNVYYTFTIASWDYSDATPNPCYNHRGCAVGIDHRHMANGQGGTPSAIWEEGCVPLAKTVGELGECLRDQRSRAGTANDNAYDVNLVLPFTAKTHHSGDALTQECVGIFYNLRGAFYGDWDPMTGSICGIAPPPVGACGMPDSLELNHGTLKASDVDGSKASAQIIIDCNMPIAAQLHLSLMSNNALPLGDGSIRSAISMNQQPMTDRGIDIDLKTGGNVVSVDSVLSAAGKPASGDFVGQGVVVLSLR